MKIYTKTGDAGQTSLVGGERVAKNSSRVCAYGDADELISWLGAIRASLEMAGDADLEAELRSIQDDLMLISAHFAAGHDVPRLAPFPAERVVFLETAIDRMTEALPPMTHFILPGGPRVAADCHIARTVCRRTERTALGIENRTEQDNLGLRYINRLSDYLFTLARFLSQKNASGEDRWTPRK